MKRKKLVIGILAHVDAGKTTLSEALLYKCGAVRGIGRVDKGTAYLDTHSLERERGITIFSKQATLELPDADITLLDTPGHVDFSCETERALCVQDYAILVVSASEGIEAHTKTLWNLLLARKIPTFIFVNKTDIAKKNRDEIIASLRASLSKECVDFSISDKDTFFEGVASADAGLMEEYFDSGEISRQNIINSIKSRKIFPCCFGSALKLEGIEKFISVINDYTESPSYQDRIFGAKVYKISRDEKNRRLTFVKITGGTLSPKDVISHSDKNGDVIEEKVEEIRVYSSEKYKPLKSAAPGTVCALLGPEQTRIGEGLGSEASDETSLTPVLDYRMLLPKETNPYEFYLKLLTLTEEDPTLGISFEERSREIKIRLMGEIQTEVQKRVIKERFGVDVDFDEGTILYKETIAAPVYGAGHFEPLRHYAEAHLLLEPLPEGSGIISDTACSPDELSSHWQRLILSHIGEKVHRGVLIGSPLTDVRVTLVAGRGHLKHTEGGDFRQATYRAIRQGLMKAESIILEPTFDFEITLPRENLGRAMTDLTSMHGSAEAPEFYGDTAVLTGNCPVLTMRKYATELRAYTKGEGKITLRIGPYKPCHNTEEVIAERAYDAELDERNTPNSVFCKNGSGYVVPWNEADALMHVSAGERAPSEEEIFEAKARKISKYSGSAADDKELMRIFEATYGKIKPRKISEKTENSAAEASKVPKPKKPKPRGEEIILIDGYNLIFAWDELRKSAERDFSLARDILIRLMCNYSSFKKCKIVIVFDAYKRKGGEGSREEIGNVSVVYTKESETADSYIEKTAHEMAEDHFLRVVTSDMQEQYIILGVGGFRVGTAEFKKEVEAVSLEIKEAIELYSK
ncbi:MAG: TetM/TetW/TetO/TetS family tetracycline resistance ribosomal protection protein [Clostridia bacterium]|nr:TetM/TetW/TetO/TetS family tetracycline resistance ribosomal protection protein [Clostridia bacterium]